ncbi:MAG: CRISPR-associated endonuclease Cas1, partial [candidate division WOR-3 bacterium]|nr:CRISPR-associated endonuclease Cas1 [candidate division WOR-3 bacterium]
IQCFTKHFKKLFNQEFTYQSNQDNFSVLPYYWRYTEIYHFDKQNPKKVQYINGCFGRLYLKGKFTDFLPFLILGSELHAGQKLSFSWGYYQLHFDSLGYFDRFFSQKSAIVHTIREVIERYDSTEIELSTEKQPFNENDFAEHLIKELQQTSYQPTPNQAFLIKKKGVGERLIEQLSFKDLIVQQYLLKILYPVFDRIFEPESIGYRKGYSREKAIELIKDAISQGYQYVIESDIEDFFPSVDLNILSQLLNFYLPQKDIITRDLLKKIIFNNYVLDNKLVVRQAGLAQGSPLSGLLANLYLDSFDEKIKQLPVKLIRYADDFIILCKTKTDAKNILSETETYLSELGLKLNKDKTTIKSIHEGFSFLGIRFEQSEIKIEPETEIRLLKKPLYITEPYCFLSLNGEAVSIVKDRVVIEVIPLRRISEIIIMEKSSLSTALIKKCTEYHIPITITLNNGYHITTIKPDSQDYYNINYEHSRRYFSLTDSEFLCLAKEVAVHKIKNYIALFKQKYTSGMNEFITELQSAVQKIYEANELNAIRGLEGIIARKIYERLNDFIDEPAFHIRKRERKNPDRINSLLNLSYYLLFSKINATLRAIGLNPYLGFLHNPSDNYESLACDIQDVFRARIDRFIIRLINLKVITKEDFIQNRNGFYLKHESAKKFINQLEAEMERKDSK